MTKIALVGCGASKKKGVHKAKNLYTSTYFQLKKEYAEKVCDSWFILSAEHGIISPEKETGLKPVSGKAKQDQQFAAPSLETKDLGSNPSSGFAGNLLPYGESLGKSLSMTLNWSKVVACSTVDCQNTGLCLHHCASRGARPPTIFGDNSWISNISLLDLGSNPSISIFSMKKSLYMFDIENGEVEKISENLEKKGRAEKVVEEYYRDQGWEILNISPAMSSKSLPEELSGLEKLIKPGAPDLFLYGKDGESNRFVEVKGKGDGLRFNQLQFMKSVDIECSVVFVQGEKEEFECPDCGKIFNSENGLNIHKGSCYTEGDEKPVKTERFTRFDQNRSSSGGSL